MRKPNPEVERVRKLHRRDRIGDEAKHRGLAYHDDESRFQRSQEVRS